MNSRDIIAAADEALRRASAPICYLHRDERQGPYAAVITIECLREITDMLPPEGKVAELMMNHGHIEGDEDDRTQGYPHTA